MSGVHIMLLNRCRTMIQHVIYNTATSLLFTLLQWSLQLINLVRHNANIHLREVPCRRFCSSSASCRRSAGLLSFCLKCCLLVHSSFSLSTTTAFFVTPSREKDSTSSSMPNTSCSLLGLHPRRAMKFTTASGRKPLSYTH